MDMYTSHTMRTHISFFFLFCLLTAGFIIYQADYEVISNMCCAHERTRSTTT